MEAKDQYKLLVQAELAARWCISEATLERWRHTKVGPVHLKLGGAVRYRMEDVLAYESQNMSDAEIDALHARLSNLEQCAAAVIDWCDKNPPAGSALYCIDRLRAAMSDKAVGHNGQGEALPTAEGGMEL